MERGEDEADAGGVCVPYLRRVGEGGEQGKRREER